MRYVDSYYTGVSYNNDNCLLLDPVVTAPNKDYHINYSSNTTANGIFHGGCNVCSLYFGTNKNDNTATISYKLLYPELFYLSRVLFAEELFTAKKIIKITVPSWLDLEIKEFNFNSSIQKKHREREKRNYLHLPDREHE